MKNEEAIIGSQAAGSIARPSRMIWGKKEGRSIITHARSGISCQEPGTTLPSSQSLIERAEKLFHEDE